jgi:hypothetical protein
MALIELNPPSLRTARVKQIPSGVQIDTPQRNIRLRLPPNCTALQFLQKVYMHPRIPMETRIEAATQTLPYQSPKLIAVVTNNNSNSGEQVLRIVGGLPKLPGTNTVFPGEEPSLPAQRRSQAQMTRETEVGSCTVNEADQNQLSVK